LFLLRRRLNALLLLRLVLAVVRRETVEGGAHGPLKSVRIEECDQFLANFLLRGGVTSRRSMGSLVMPLLLLLHHHLGTDVVIELQHIDDAGSDPVFLLLSFIVS
jgi:hypothetical protein